jgi:hypothetical protein
MAGEALVPGADDSDVAPAEDSGPVVGAASV